MDGLASRKLKISLLLVLGLIVFGTIGYKIIENYSLVDGLYMTIITLSTVGFGEPQELGEAGRLFSIILILAGVGVGAWALQSAVEILLSEQLWGTIRRRRMAKTIEGLENHFIICGSGRLGAETRREVRRRGVDFVVVEANKEKIEELTEKKILHVRGDATEDDALIHAGIKKARGLVAALERDADNLMAVLTAKQLNPKVMTVARATTDSVADKLRRAGADRVVTPFVTGGQRMALALLRPVADEFLRSVLYTQGTSSQMGEVPLHKGSQFIGKAFGEFGFHKRSGAALIAVKRSKGNLVIGPPATDLMEEGDVLLVVAEPDKLKELEHS